MLAWLTMCKYMKPMPGISDLDPKWFRLVSKDKPRTISDEISVHFASASQNVLKYILKSSGFVRFGANLKDYVLCTLANMNG